MITTCHSQAGEEYAPIDVVICTYNNAAMLSETLESIAGQMTSKAIEFKVLVVDNASTDGTAQVVDGFAATGRIPHLRRVYEAEQGLVPARIRGVLETSAPWIAFVDDDCVLANDWVSNAASFIKAHPECGGFGGIVRLKFEHPPAEYVRRYKYSFAEQEHGETEQPREWLVGAGMVLNRAALVRTGWIEKQYLGDRKGNLLLSGGDMEMVLRIRSLGYELWYTPTCLIHHCIPARRLSLPYLVKINYGLGVSQTWCDFLSWRGSYWRFIGSTIAGFLRSLKTVCRQAAGCVLRRRSLADVRVTFSFAKGRAAGFRQLLKLRREQRQEIQGKARSRATVTHIGLLHWGDLMEDFLSEINVSLKEFREEMTGGWMFGYIRALKMCGIDSTLICVSAQVHRIETWTHLPTGARICVLPASRLYRWLAGHGISSAVWKNDSVPQRSFFVRTGVRFLQDLLPYLATPVTQLRRELKTRKIDAILCQEYEHARFDLSMVAGVLSKVPVYATFQGGNTQFSRLERLFRPMSIHKSAGLIIGSSRESDRVRKKFGLSERRIARIFNPLDLSMWYPEERRPARLKLQLPEEAFLVIWHGRVDLWRKGLDTLIEGWRRFMTGPTHLDAYLVLVGDGSDSERLREVIGQNDVPHIIWRREYVLDRAVMRQYLSAGDVYAFTSRHEGFPVAPLEAMACGLPVVATDCVGVRDILDGESYGGFIVPVDDVARLAEKLAALSDDQVLRQTMSRHAREHVMKSFSLSTVGNQLRDFFSVQNAL